MSAREQETGAVRNRTITHRELCEVPVPLHSSSVQIERVEVNRFVDAEFAPRDDANTLIVPVFEYVPLTELKLMLMEKLRITTVITRQTEVHVAEVQ